MQIDTTGKKVLVGISGGKDSTAMACKLVEMGVEFEPYFLDTGWEHPDTLAHIDYLEQFFGKITRIGSIGFADLVRKKGMFPGRTIRFCTTLLKINPFREHYGLESMSFRDDIISCTGERSEESPSRAKKPTFERDDWYGCWIWRPIKEMKVEEVFEVAKRHGIEPNPLYKRASKRVGCFPCIFANKSDYKAIKHDPFGAERIEVIRGLEKEVGYPWVVSGDRRGIDAHLEWCENEDQQELFSVTEHFSCSSFYKLCE